MQIHVYLYEIKDNFTIHILFVSVMLTMIPLNFAKTVTVMPDVSLSFVESTYHFL